MSRPKTSQRRQTREEVRSLAVHFMASLDGCRADYEHICSLIKGLGHTLVTDHVLKRTWADIEKEDPEESKLMTKKLHGWIQKADVVIFEISTPSVSIGYEVALAFTNYIPVILVYREKTGQVPHGLKGIDNDLLQLLPYTDDSLSDTLELALNYAQNQITKRVYITLTVPLLRYLDWIERTHQLSVSMYMRLLIEDDMNRNRAYQAHLQNQID